MKKISHPIDKNNQYFVDFEYDEDKKSFSGGLKYNANAHHKDKRVEKSLHKIMSLSIDGKKIPLKTSGAKEGYYNHFEFEVPKEKISQLKIFLRDNEFGKFKINPQSKNNFFGEDRSSNKLTSFELRSMAREDDVPEVPFARHNISKIHGKTDLHTHFAAIVGAKDMLQGALDKKGEPIIYPCPLLDSLGINYDKDKVVEENLSRKLPYMVMTGKDYGKGVPLRRENFSKRDLEKLESSMHIPVDKQATFVDLELVYDYRMPFTKNDGMFETLLDLSAKTYKDQGVVYAEPTFTKMADPNWVKRINKVMPSIEKKHGVKMRFLAGMVRFFDEPTNMLRIEKLKKLAKSPYIAGVDFMGQEINRTKDFGKQLEEICKWSSENDPNFSIKVHAGESSLHKDNIKDALKIAKKYNSRMRIGHGLYGLDDETMNLFKETGAIVEFNMHSNLALNNIDGVGQLPIAKYLNEGVSVVLSSDGGGIYQSDAQQEALVARFAGVTNSGMKAIRQTEKQYLKIQDEYMKSKEEKPDAYEVDFDKMPQEASYINESRKIKAHKLAIEQKNHQKLHEKIDFSDKKREELFKEGHPVFISGSGTSIDYMDKKDRLEIYTALEVLMDSLDNKKSYFVTSGYKHGVEGLFHAMKKRKEKAPKVLAVLAKDTKFSNTDYKAVDAGLFLGKDKFYRSWHEMNYLNERKGSAVFFGGGSITNDQIQSAVNFDLDYYLLSGVNGSSASKALYDKKHSCRGAEELVKSFYKKNKQLFRQDFNLDRLPSYVKASRRRVDKAIVEKRKIEIKEVNKKHGKLDKNILTKMKNIGRI